MNESNPYAPPQVTELEAYHDRCWKLHGDELLVKNGATLPEVDLESGATVDQAPLHVSKYSHQETDSRVVVSITITFACFALCKWLFAMSNATIFVIVISISFFVSFLISLSGKGSQPCTIWLFTEKRQRKRKMIRRNLRIAATLLLILPVFGIIRITRSPDLQWLLFGFLVWVGLILALGIWSIFDKPKYKFKEFSPGWLSIAPIHPKAFEYLQQLEFTEHSALSQTASIPIRRVRTMYLYRLPLRMLIYGSRNPLTIVLITLMKYLRSTRLERLFYDDSEATELSQSELSSAMSEACDRWFSLHSDWIFVKASSLDSPLKDLQTETATIASTDLSSTVIITLTTSTITPHKAQVHNQIASWIDDGQKSVTTYDCPYLALRDAHLAHRAYGSLQDIYEEHLSHFSGYSFFLPKNINELRELLLHRQLETNELLEAQKIQSAVVEHARYA